MASTVINTLYPPIIETYQPAFVNTDLVPVTFSLSNFNSINDVKRVHVSIVDQRNNSNVLKNSKEKASQGQINGQPIESSYAIINGILIADMPKFEKQTDKQQIGLFQYDPAYDIYAINLSPDWLNRDIAEGQGYWNNNQYYQVQIRFDSSDNDEWDNSYLLTQRPYFSEWSSITLIKPILEPIISIQQLTTTGPNIVQKGDFEIVGSVQYNESMVGKDGVSPETERLQAYRIIVKETVDTIEKNSIDSGWIYAKQNLLISENTMIDYLLDLSVAETDTPTIIIYGQTNNGYVWHENYPITLTSTILDPYIDNIHWNNRQELESNNDIYINQEDGSVEINFSAEPKDKQSNLEGVFYFRRARLKDSDHNIVGSWDLVYRYEYSWTNNNSIQINFNDNTVSSLYTYQYRVQFYNTKEKKWGSVFFSNSVYPKFYDMLLTRQDKQIAIRYNGQITSWKPTVNRQKIDTLGGRYPKFVENAAMNYKTFQISGLISAEEDFNRKFLDETNSSYSYDFQNYEKEFGSTTLLRNDTFADGEIAYPDKNQIHGLVQTWKEEIDEQTGERKQKPIYQTIDGKDIYSNSSFSGQLNEQHDSYPHNHWLWEREFREGLVAWLNDGEPKLYRSMPEGNIIVMLTDVNLTPNTQLGRMLYNFSATMYEVGDGYDLNQLNRLGIINFPKSTLNFINGTTDGTISEDNIIANIGRNETRVGQTQISSQQTVNLINGTTIDSDNASNKPFNFSNDIWDAMTIADRLNEYYQTAKIKPAENSIKISGADLYFISPPQYYKLENGAFSPTLDKTPWLGYVFQVNQNNTSATDTQNRQEIFVNQKGYYHIPSDINILSLSLPPWKLKDEDYDLTIHQTANMVYKYNFYLVSSDSTPAKDDTVLDLNFIGQYHNFSSLPLGDNIISLIKENHTKLIYDNFGNTTSQITLDPIKGLSLDITPYTYLEYIHRGESEPLSLIIGETGVFDSFQDWDLSSLVFYGRRFSEIETYPFHIEEWNYYKDTRVANPVVRSDVQVPIAPTFISINGMQYQNIEKEWEQIEQWNYQQDGFLSVNHLIDTIGAPQFNTVYTFIKTKENNKKEFYYQIYYIDGNWYPAIFLKDGTLLAAVPIYGTVTYCGQLMEKSIKEVSTDA